MFLVAVLRKFPLIQDQFSYLTKSSWGCSRKFPVFSIFESRYLQNTINYCIINLFEPIVKTAGSDDVQLNVGSVEGCLNRDLSTPSFP